MKKIKKILFIPLLTTMMCVGGAAFTSCDDTESYADLLEKERKACNAWLANFEVENSLPEDINDAIIGTDAPYYRIDEEGNLYMQILSLGDLDDMAEYDELIYFRFKRMSIVDWWIYDNETWSGNADDMTYTPTSFRYDNYSLSSTSQYGRGLQAPLKYLGIGCEVNIVIKSQFGFSEEIAYVTPFLYNVRYFRPQT